MEEDNPTSPSGQQCEPGQRSMSSQLVPLEYRSQRPIAPRHPSEQKLSVESVHKLLNNVLDARKQEEQKQLDQQAKDRTKAEAFKRSILVESQQHFDLMRQSILRDVRYLVDPPPQDRWREYGRGRQDDRFRRGEMEYNDPYPYREPFGRNTWRPSPPYGTPAIGYQPSSLTPQSGPVPYQPKVEEPDAGQSYPSFLGF